LFFLGGVAIFFHTQEQARADMRVKRILLVLLCFGLLALFFKGGLEKFRSAAGSDSVQDSSTISLLSSPDEYPQYHVRNLLFEAPLTFAVFGQQRSFPSAVRGYGLESRSGAFPWHGCDLVVEQTALIFQGLFSINMYHQMVNGIFPTLKRFRERKIVLPNNTLLVFAEHPDWMIRAREIATLFQIFASDGRTMLLNRNQRGSICFKDAYLSSTEPIFTKLFIWQFPQILLNVGMRAGRSIVGCE
jgi:hypothetical protein